MVRRGTEFESPAFSNGLPFRLKVDMVMGWYWTHSSVRVLGCLTFGTSAFYDNVEPGCIKETVLMKDLDLQYM